MRGSNRATTICYADVEYKSLTSACDALGLSAVCVSSYAGRHGMTLEDTVVLFMNNDGHAPLESLFSEDDDELLIQKYPTNGANIPELLVRYTAGQIRSRAYRLGVKVLRWTSEDLEVLKSKYSSCGCNIPELLGKFTAIQIQTQASRLKLKIVRWSEEDISLLVERYPSYGSNIPELLIKRDVASIRKKARSLGLKFTGSAWSPDEISLLRDCYPSAGCDIPVLRKRHNSNAIRRMANRLGLSHKARLWSAEELDLIRVGYANGVRPIILGRSPDSVSWKARELGLKLTPAVWSAEEDAIVRDNYMVLTSKQIAELLPGRTDAAVMERFATLGLGKSEDCGAVTRVDGFVYVQCKVCGGVFLIKPNVLREFSHVTHVNPVPDGWYLPARYILEKTGCR